VQSFVYPWSKNLQHDPMRAFAMILESRIGKAQLHPKNLSLTNVDVNVVPCPCLGQKIMAWTTKALAIILELYNSGMQLQYMIAM